MWIVVIIGEVLFMHEILKKSLNLSRNWIKLLLKRWANIQLEQQRPMNETFFYDPDEEERFTGTIAGWDIDSLGLEQKKAVYLPGNGWASFRKI